MTGDSTDHIPGQMDIDDQRRTFHGFMQVTIWSSLLTVVLVLYFTLIFAVGVAPFASLGASFVVGAIGGVSLRMASAYYITLVGLAVLAVLVTGFVYLMAGFMG